MELFHKMISGSLGIPERQIASTLHLLGEGATIPFISRYRKEATGGLDEVQICKVFMRILPLGWNIIRCLMEVFPIG